MTSNNAVPEIETLQTLGRFFRNQRRKSHYTLEAAAALLDIPQKTVEEFEEGQRQLPLEDIISLSNCYNIEPDLIVRLVFAVGIDDRQLFEELDCSDD